MLSPRMKSKIAIIIGGILILAGASYMMRHKISDAWYEFNRPDLPKALAYTEETLAETQVTQAPAAPVEGGMSTSEHFALESSPQQKVEPKDPLQSDVQIPTDINLDVPWMSQAPFSDWGEPYQEACEEASMIMLDKFFDKQTYIAPADADKAIQDLVAYENTTRGDYKDTTAEETAVILREKFGYTDVRVMPFDTSDDIKNIVGRGIPVIIPFSGKELKNPNFRNGGPLYHMLVVKGYTADGLFITADPGTRKGKDYTYSFSRIVEAAHDWNGGNVVEGEKVMIVVLPEATASN